MTALLRKLALQDKVALITGGGRGIGAACAKLFAKNGAKVVITSRTQGDLDKVVDQIADTDKVFAIPTDIGDEKCVLELFKQVERRFGPVDIMVNNAAVIAKGEVTEFEVSEWDELMRVNLRGSFLCAREAFRQMKASGRGGSIVNVSSLGGIRGTEKFKGFSAYTVSKHGIVGLTESLAVEGREYGIRVNCVAPGAVDTEMLKKAALELKTKTRPEDIARAIFFFCDESQSGPMVNGAILEIHSNL